MEQREVRPIALRRGDSFWKLVALAWLAIVLAAGLLWLRLDNSGPTWWDQSRHARNALALTDIFFDMGKGHTLLDFLQHYDFYPPLSYMPTVPFHMVLGRKYDIACLSILLFWVPLLFASTVAVGRLLLGRRAGWFAGILVTSYPMVVAFSKEYMTDLQTAAMTSVGLWALLRSNLLFTPKAKRAALFGFVGGLTLLTKWSMGLYLMGPVLMALARGLGRSPRRMLKNSSIALLAGLPLPLVWYSENAKAIVKGLMTETQWGNYPPVFSLESFLFYGRVLIEGHLCLPMALLFVTGLAVLIRKKQRLFRWLIVSLAVIYVGLTLIHNKDPRFCMAFLPYVALATSGLVLASASWVRRAGAAVAVALAVFTLVSVLFRVPFLPERVGRGWFTLYSQRVMWMAPPRRQPDPALHAELDARAYWMCAHEGKPPGKAVVDVRVDRLWLHGYRLWYYADMNGGILRAAVPGDYPWHDQPGRPPAGPPSVDFRINYEKEVPRDAPHFEPLASYPTYEIGELAVLSASKNLMNEHRETWPVAVFSDHARGNALCLRRAELPRTTVRRGGKLEIDSRWTVAARNPYKGFEYVHRLRAEGPTPFTLEWVGPHVWVTGDSRYERAVVDVPADILPGTYSLSLSLEERKRKGIETPARLAVIRPGPDHTSVPVGQVRIE